MNIGALSLLNPTSSRKVFNIAGWHSRHSLTWSWVLAIALQFMAWPKPFAYWSKTGFGLGLGQMLSFALLTKSQGWDLSISFLWLRLTLMRQREMWFADLYRRARDEADGLRGVQDIEALAVHEFRDGVSPRPRGRGSGPRRVAPPPGRCAAHWRRSPPCVGCSKKCLPPKTGQALTAT